MSSLPNKLKQSCFLALLLLAAGGWCNATFALTIGICFSLLLGNPFVAVTGSWSKSLLQLSVVGLGFGIGIAQVLRDGQQAVPYTIIAIVSVLLAGHYIGRLCGVAVATSRLISFGTAICGGSAIAALAPVIKAKPEEVAVSLATIFSLNALGLLIFPIVGHLLNMDQQSFGLWAALAIHDTSSVVGATSEFGAVALETGVTVKLTRALWIAPCVLLLSFLGEGKGKVQVPFFILGFIGAASVRTVWPQYEITWDLIAQIGRQLLIATLFLIGAGLTRSVVRQVGVFPLLQGVVLWILISATSLVAIQQGMIQP